LRGWNPRMPRSCDFHDSHDSVLAREGGSGEIGQIPRHPSEIGRVCEELSFGHVGGFSSVMRVGFR
jgi:hypothetical protein